MSSSEEEYIREDDNGDDGDRKPRAKRAKVVRQEKSLDIPKRENSKLSNVMIALGLQQQDVVVPTTKNSTPFVLPEKITDNLMDLFGVLFTNPESIHPDNIVSALEERLSGDDDNLTLRSGNNIKRVIDLSPPEATDNTTSAVAGATAAANSATAATATSSIPYRDHHLFGKIPEYENMAFKQVVGKIATAVGSAQKGLGSALNAATKSRIQVLWDVVNDLSVASFNADDNGFTLTLAKQHSEHTIEGLDNDDNVKAFINLWNKKWKKVEPTKPNHCNSYGDITQKIIKGYGIKVLKGGKGGFKEIVWHKENFRGGQAGKKIADQFKLLTAQCIKQRKEVKEIWLLYCELNGGDPKSINHLLDYSEQLE